MSHTKKLLLRPISYNGVSISDGYAVCEFGLGEKITVGRGAGNHLVLEDSSRLVSRYQASVSYKDTSSALITNTSASTEMFIGAMVLHPGESVVISLSDTLIIGAYILRLQQSSTLPIEQSAAIFPLPNTAAVVEKENLIPADFDFFSVTKSAAETEVFNAPFGCIDDTDDNNSLIDSLYSISMGSGCVNQEIQVDDESLLQAEQNLDPLVLLSIDPKDSSKVTYSLDEGHEINSLFLVPRAINQAQSIHNSESTSDLLSNNFASKKNSITKPLNVDAQNQIVSSRNAHARLSNSHRQAFARGLKIDACKLPEFSPEFFEVLGGALLHLTAGAVNMMHGRAHIKHEMRADVTIIASSGNNPLKFAPDAQSALMHLIGDQVPGFMHSVEAIDDAFDDLLAHQIGLVSGARVAVYEVVKNFSPEKIQKHKTSDNVLDSLLSISRKSKLWDLYEAYYAEVSGNARENFELRFQQAFSQAYEMEIDRMCEARERT